MAWLVKVNVLYLYLADAAEPHFYVQPTLFNGGAFHFYFGFAAYSLAALQEHFHGGSASFRQVNP